MKKNKYDVTVYAKQDLILIRRFTSKQWGLEQSANYLNNLKKTLQLLAEMPLMGQKCVDFDEIDKNIYRFPHECHTR